MDAKYQDVKFLAGPEHLRNVYHYFHYRRPEDVGFVKCLFETNVYNYYHYCRHVNNYFPRRPVHDYFLYIVPNLIRSETHASKV
mgnify:CR=1 FL=1